MMKLWISVLQIFRLCILLAVLHTAAIAQQPSGFGSFEPDRSQPCLNEDERRTIQQDLQQNIAALKAEGRLQLPELKGAVSFIEPIQVAAGVDAFRGVAISNFVDHNTGSNALQDYQCGTRTYDTATYNHQGIDYFGWPFGWYQMDNDQVEIVAAADGVIIQKLDGWFDRSCSFSGAQWNAVYLMHADSSITWYGHMKANSTTSKAVGETVVAGEYLGIMGSSGNSTGPHLHFEVYNADGDLIDPFAGPCNTLNLATWWQNQTPYYDSGINQMLLHSNPPVFPACPNQEIVNIKNSWLPGETAYFASYFRDHLQGQTSNLSILKPDGSIWQTWTHTPTSPHFIAAYYYWTWIFPATAEAGTWTFRIEFEGQTYNKTFIMNSLTGTGENDGNNLLPKALELAQNYPNPFNPATQINYSVPTRSHVTLRVYNMMGQEVAELVNSSQAAGNYSVDFNAANLPSGSYLYRLNTETGSLTHKMMLLK